jgi:hypothetical protein
LTSGKNLLVDDVLGSGPKFDFLAGTPTIEQASEFGLHVGTSAYQGPLIENFNPHDIIDLASIGSVGLKLNYSASTGVLQITTRSGGVVASLRFQNASLGAGSFHLASGTGGRLITHS